MRITRIDLHWVRLPLIRPFRTSNSLREALEHVLVQVRTDDGLEGWGESASPSDPFYCPETTRTCWHLLEDFLGPMVLGRDWSAVEDLVRYYGVVKGNNFAKAGLEMACWDVLGRRSGVSLAGMLGGSRSEILSGVSLGIQDEVERLFGRVDEAIEQGYRRVKLKISPGKDVEVVRAVRRRYPDLPLQVDANSAYTLDDIEVFEAMDDLGLLLIEQPLAHDDIVDHAKLQSRLKTAICLDESIHSAEDARKALELGACRTINIKVSRLGGLLESRKVHDVCAAHGVPVWVGGMHEFGIGRAANLAIASLPNVTLPGDVAGSDRYYREDIIEPPIRAERGTVPVPRGPGLGVEAVLERIEANRLRHERLHV